MASRAWSSACASHEPKNNNPFFTLAHYTAMNKKFVATLFFLPALALSNDELLVPDTGAAEQRAQVYHTPRERREAGLGTQLTDWLSLSGLAKIKATSFTNSFRNPSPDSGRDDALSAVQIGFKLEMSEQVESLIVLDFEDNKTGSVLDEVFIELKSGNWDVSVGTQTLPFGSYYSNFITGPLLEFGETRKTALLVGYNYHDRIEFSGFTYQGNARQQNTEDRIRDWAAAVEAKLIGNTLLLGASYISDVADSDAQLLENFEHKYQQKVGAWSAYAVARTGRGEMSFEILQAASAFQELPANANQPRAWNFEIAYHPKQTWQVAARYERSAELSEHPERRYGIAATWLAYDIVTITFEYLRSDFKSGFVFDDAGNELRQQALFATQLSLEF